MLAFLGVLALALAVNGDTQCVTSCKGLADGEYQSCKGCNYYVSCWNNGIVTTILPCPGGFLWDDNKKYCDYKSDTCDGELKGKVPKIGQCVADCTDIVDGNYQHCSKCDVYVSCNSGKLLNDRPCSPGLVWDDVLKTCAFGSATCEEPFLARPARAACITSCHGLKEGDYQSCLGCDVFATCTGNSGKLTDNRKCPENLVWDDNKKYCDFQSSTCGGTVDPGATVAPGVCLRSCSGMADGLYQSCDTCLGFVQCHAGHLHEKECQDNLKWNDVVKMCDHSSPTCDVDGGEIKDCVSDCTGVADGFYAACSDCTNYVWCSRDETFESPCPSKSVWDTEKGTCVLTNDLSCSKKSL